MLNGKLRFAGPFAPLSFSLRYGLVVFNICSSSYFFICFGTLLHITRPRTKTRHSTIATAAEIVIWTSMVGIFCRCSSSPPRLSAPCLHIHLFVSLRWRSLLTPRLQQLSWAGAGDSRSDAATHFVGHIILLFHTCFLQSHD